MATVSWVNPGTSGNYSDAAVWTAPAGPAAGDDVFVDGSSQIYTVTLTSSTLALDSLTVGNTSVGGTNPGSGDAIVAIGSNTLNVTGGGTNTVTLSNAGTEITLNGGTLQATSLSVGFGAAVEGFGQLSLTNLSGAGAILAAGSTLEITASLTASDGLQFEAVGHGILQFDSTVANGNAFSFLDNTGGMIFANDTGMNATFSGMTVGTGGAVTDFITIAGVHSIVSATGSGANSSTSGTITLDDGTVLSLTNLSSTNWNIDSQVSGGNTTFFVSDTACYGRGTRILTACGEVPVEDLSIGDLVITASGDVRPIKWLGQRTYEGRFIAGDRNILPVHIAAGALGEGAPARDLLVSPQHALYLNGVLVPARLLVDGINVVQAEKVERVEYFHVELETHDIIFAEGAPAESYIECDNRGMFHNAAEFAALYPDDARPSALFCAPRLETGAAELDAIRADMARRGAAIEYERAA